MKDFLFRGAACLLLVVGLGQQGFAEDFTIDRLLAAQCAQCHGTNGHAVGDMDGLDDESFKDLYEGLTDMRKEDRADDIMDHQALGYTRRQIRRIARFYASLSGKTGEAPGSGD